ncbi:MAG: dipeptidase [Christensenellaceae bacterium]
MVCDFHNDFLTDKRCKEILNGYKGENVKVVSAVFKGKRSFADVVKIIDEFRLSKSENCYLAFEDLGYDSPEEINFLLKYEPIYCTLTWNGENLLGYGCYGPDGSGLKKAGFNVIKTLNEKKIYADVAHINKQGFYDVIDKAELVVNSHTAFTGAYAHIRNSTDEQLRLLVERGALIGVVLYSAFLTDKKLATVDDFVKHIDYFVQRFGCKNICIGSDFYGADNFVSGVEGYEDFGVIEKSLLHLGYGKEAVERILYKNLESFLLKSSIDKSGK